jgi:hypothetical protein
MNFFSEMDEEVYCVKCELFNSFDCQLLDNAKTLKTTFEFIFIVLGVGNSRI